MDDEPIIHPRIHERHPQISEHDVLDAWHGALLSAPRMDGSGSWITVGMDSNGRLLEMVSINRHGRWLIYHAMTPHRKRP